MSTYNCILLSDNAEGLHALAGCFEPLRELVSVVFASFSDEDPEELALLYQPDIIVMDKDRDHEETIGLINAFETVSPGVRMIAFTDYRRFSFELSVERPENVSFLPRPLSREALHDSIITVVNALNAIRERDFSPRALDSLLSEYIPIIRQHYLSMLLRRPLPETENVVQKFETLKIDCPGPLYTVIVAEISSDGPIENFEAVSFLLRTNIKTAITAAGYPCYIFFDSSFKINCLVGSDSERTGARLEKILIDVKHHFEKMASLRFRAGIGSTVDQTAHIHSSYMDAEMALNHARREEDGIVLFRNINAGDWRRLLWDRAIHRALALYAEGENGKFLEILDSCRLNHRKIGDAEELKKFVVRFMLRAADGLEALGIEPLSCTSLPFLLSRVYASSDIEELDHYLEEFVQQLQSLRRGNASQENQLLEKALNYIHENIADPSLDLEKVSAALGISKSYFCRIFHQLTNQNFSSYIRSQRIERAKALLLQGEYKTYEVAEATGFASSKYFSSVFKQVTGMSPSEYPKKARGV